MNYKKMIIEAIEKVKDERILKKNILFCYKNIGLGFPSPF